MSFSAGGQIMGLVSPYHNVSNVAGFQNNGFSNPQNDLMDPKNARQIWLGNLQDDVTTEDLCNVIRGGAVINIKMMIEKHCAFVTFADPKSAAEFFRYALVAGVTIKSRRIKIGWGKPIPLTDRLQDALNRGCTRNIYLGGIDNSVTENKLRTDFAEFGEIEQIYIIRNKNTGFVNFTSLLNAVSAFERIQRNPDYNSCTIRYGKDRCSNLLRLVTPRHPNSQQAFPQQQQQQHNIYQFHQNQQQIRPQVQQQSYQLNPAFGHFSGVGGPYAHLSPFNSAVGESPLKFSAVPTSGYPLSS